MSDQDPFPDGEFTRRKAKIQVGDGPDARGEITVETVRSESESADYETVSVNIDGASTNQQVRIDHASFAEFAFEVERAVLVLRDQLGIDGD